MNPIYRGPFGPLGGGQGAARAGVEVPPRREDEFPRSLPEDRSEGNLNPDPNVECHGSCPPQGEASGEAQASGAQPPSASGHPLAGMHHPSGEPEDDDGAGNPLPREVEEPRYGLDDADDLEWAQRGRRSGPDE